MFAVDADPRYGKFGLRSECPSCGAHLPVNGPTDGVECADCGEDVVVPDEVVSWMLEVFEDRWPDPPQADTLTVGDMTWRWTAAPVESPVCPVCATPLTSEPEASPEACPGCAATIPREQVPRGLRGEVPTARWVIGGEVDQSRAQLSTAPLALQCPSCGAGLSITNRHQRLTPCEHCGSRVHIPDPVWRALHPPRTVEPWFVRFEGESRPARDARLERERAERERQEKLDKQRRRAESRAREREREAKESERNAELARQRAQQAAAAARVRMWISLPLVGLGALATLGAYGMGAVSALFFVFGHGRAARLMGLSALAAHVINDGLIFVALACAAVAWIVGVAGATRASGTAFLPAVAWSAFMLLLSIIPAVGLFVGLFFAVQHFRGAEPTLDAESRVPLYASVPLGFVHLGFPLLFYLTLAVLGRTGFHLIPP